MNPYDIMERAIAVIKKLESDPRVIHVEIVGSMRRGKSDVGDLDLLLVTDDPWSFHNFPTRYGSRRDRSRMADVFVATPMRYGAALAVGTGPRQLTGKLIERAHERGLIYDVRHRPSNPVSRFTPFPGLYQPDGQLIPTPTEESFFRMLDVPFVPPNYREWLAERL